VVVRERHPALATSRLAAFAIEAVRLAHEFRGTRARASVALGGWRCTCALLRSASGASWCHVVPPGPAALPVSGARR